MRKESSDDVKNSASSGAPELRAALDDTDVSTDTSPKGTKPASEGAEAADEADSPPAQDQQPSAISAATSVDEEEAQTAGQTSDSAPTQAAGEGSESTEGGGTASTPPDVEKKSVVKKSNSRAPPPPFVDDPSKITLRFIFANRDGLIVTVDCQPTDTVGEVKGILLSMWPDELPECSGGDKLRLICMGKGILMPDTRTLKDCEVPVFKTHATPVNVAITPEHHTGKSKDRSSKKAGGSAATADGRVAGSAATASTGCSCVIL